MTTNELDRIDRRIGHVERELQAHGTELVKNSQAINEIKTSSAERLEYIRERFDSQGNTEAEHYRNLLERLDNKNTSSKWLVNLTITCVFAFIVGVNYVYIEPLVESMNAIERRLLDVEKNVRVDSSAEPK